jgi:hypothetical protein
MSSTAAPQEKKRREKNVRIRHEKANFVKE